MKIGIDKIGFYTSTYYLDLATLAEIRGVDVNKFHIGLGQRKMAVAAPDEDVVTLGANAAKQLLQGIDVQQIETLLFATESGIDQSKAAGVYIHNLLTLPKRCRVVEVKQACYGSTFALQTAVSLVRQRPEKKVLLIAADIARYGLHTLGESSQGCGAVAMLIGANPRVLALEAESGLYTDDVMDFWRPNYRSEALVEGKYSSKMYLHALQQTFAHYRELSGRRFVDHDYFLYHTPVPRLVEKAHKALAAEHQVILSNEQVKQQLRSSLEYAGEIGNSYTAALYISLISLCDNEAQDLAGKRIGFYSYGSGCVAEYFSGVIQPEYRTGINTTFHQNLLATRIALQAKEYERFFNTRLPEDGSAMQLPEYNKGAFRLDGIENHKRRYVKVRPLSCVAVKSSSHAISPGKLILSGEHAVVYGKPAIAIAINRFVKTSIISGENDDVSFDLFDLQYHKSVALNTLRASKTGLKRKYKKFLSAECTIRDVLKQPFQLVQFAAIHLIDHISPQRIKGLKIETHSDIPVGCGMGSSAAVTLSVLRALNEYYQLDLDNEQYLKLGYETEKLQHGYPSRIDLHIALHGGCIYFHDDRVEMRPLPRVPMFLVNTGKPDASTGESVLQVAQHFANNDEVWDEFEGVTIALDRALQQNDLAAVQDLVRDNHRLLQRIGIVPKKVSDFIMDVEQLGAAAKVCGAGSVNGECAGAVLVITRSIAGIKTLCRQYDYTIEPVEVVAQGLQAA